MEITLFSSDSNGQYKKDIYNVIAAPRSATYRFRYKSKYIEESLLSQIRENSLVGAKALIAFRSNSDQPGIDPFMVPIRWATVKETFFISEICIVTFTVGEYPQFNQAFFAAAKDFHTNKIFSNKFFKKHDRNDKYVFPLIPDMVDRGSGEDQDSEKRWIAIIEALKQYPSFANSIFYRTVLPTQNKDTYPSHFEIKEKEYKEVELWHYCANDTAICSADVEAVTDANLINPISGTRSKIECRYDRSKYGFQGLHGTKGSMSQITFNIVSLDENDSPIKAEETKITIEAKIKKRWSQRIVRAILSFVGSALISAVATIVSLDTKFPLWICIVLLLIGSLLAAVNWLFSGDD